jgi:hypothetical protein
MIHAGDSQLSKNRIDKDSRVLNQRHSLSAMHLSSALTEATFTKYGEFL